MNGLFYGGWGRENYGTKPIKVEALQVRVNPSIRKSVLSTIALDQYNTFPSQTQQA